MTAKLRLGTKSVAEIAGDWLNGQADNKRKIVDKAEHMTVPRIAANRCYT